VSVRIQIRRGTSIQWSAANPTLADGEMGFETDTSKIKIGDGIGRWTQLSYADFGIHESSNITALAPIIYDPITKTISLQDTLTATGVDGANF
jgi:hypothetical protein